MRPFKSRVLVTISAAAAQFTFLFIAISCVLAGAPTVAYHLEGKFKIGGTAGWDYIAIDSAARRLYVPHVSRVEVLDADSGQVVGQIANTPGVHGIALAPELRKGFTSNGAASHVSVINLDTLSHVEEIKVGEDPDAILFDPDTKRVFVSNGESDEITVIDAVSDKVVGTVPVGGGPEYLATDGKGTLWVNVQEKNSFVTIDVPTLKREKTTRIAACKEPTSMASDPGSHRLFIGCRGGSLAVLDADSGKLIKTFPIGEHVDATAFDPADQLILTSTGDGFITVVHQDSPNAYSLVGTVKTLRGAKTMIFDSKTRNLYLPTVEGVPPGMSGPPKQSGAGSYKPGLFEVLVVKP